MTERRKHERFELKIPVRTDFSQRGERRSGSGYLINISVGGAYMAHEQMLRLGRIVDVSFDAPREAGFRLMGEAAGVHTPFSIKARGKILRRAYDADHVGKCCVAVGFVDGFRIASFHDNAETALLKDITAREARVWFGGEDYR